MSNIDIDVGGNSNLQILNNQRLKQNISKFMKGKKPLETHHVEVQIIPKLKELLDGQTSQFPPITSFCLFLMT